MRSYLVQYSKLIKALFDVFVIHSNIALNVVTQFILQRFSRNTQSFKVTNFEVCDLSKVTVKYILLIKIK